MNSDAITVHIPADLAESVALAIRSHADWLRRDSGHSPDGIAALNLAADRLGAIADDIRNRSKEP